jgi:asparagine synthase (glutamine-hydrolysing)
MLRYVIIVGDPQSASDAHVLEEARRQHLNSPMEWRIAINSPGFHAAYVDDGTCIASAIFLRNQRGVIFGQLFRSSCDETPPESIRSMSVEVSEAIVESRGEVLLSRYWGYYVAALHYPERRTARVLRAPASPLACFHLKRETLSVFCSYLEDCVALRLKALSINWDSITAQIVGGDYLGHETAINGIESVECGESIEHTPGGCSTHRLWEPQQFLQNRSLSEFSEAARALRKTVDDSVHALSRGHEGILVKISGGLDSSIVLSALARASQRPRLTAVTYYSRGCGDERSYARVMARSVNCPLLEYVRNEGLDLRRFHDCRLTARPVLNFSAPDAEARNAALARAVGATAIFDGELGDNVFGRTPAPGVLVECLRRNGLGRQFLSSAIDYAMLTQQSFWRTLALAHKESTNTFISFSTSQILRDRYGVDGAGSMRLASAEADRHYESIAERFLHPWLERARALAPDSHKLLYGLLTVTSTAYHSPFGAPDDAPRVSPLNSQPLVETALRIPGYLHCASARDRAVARAAFSDSLPAKILHRGLGKGGPGLWARDVVESNAEFLREFLLGGTLVERGLLDRNKVEAALSSRVVKSTAMLTDVFAKLYIEAWVRRFAQVDACQRVH